MEELIRCIADHEVYFTDNGALKWYHKHDPVHVAYRAAYRLPATYIGSELPSDLSAFEARLNNLGYHLKHVLSVDELMISVIKDHEH